MFFHYLVRPCRTCHCICDTGLNTVAHNYECERYWNTEAKSPFYKWLTLLDFVLTCSIIYTLYDTYVVKYNGTNYTNYFRDEL